jgi:RNA polymerase sigma-70 factor (ECF subfamily)
VPPAEESDEQLVERANQGDTDAFEALYVRHREWVVAAAYRFTADRDDALEVLQEAFSYLFNKFPGLKLTSTLRAFLYPTVKHLSIDRVRKRRPTVAIEAIAEELPHAPSAGAGAGLGLSRALAQLPAAQREVVLLRFVDDMTLDQIAGAVEAPLGTVKSRLHNALETLRERVKNL